MRGVILACIPSLAGVVADVGLWWAGYPEWSSVAVALGALWSISAVVSLFALLVVPR
jgi:hypothetical protein